MKKTTILSLLILLALTATLFSSDKYLTNTQTFPWIGPDGEDPEVVFADLIEQEKLVSVHHSECMFWYDNFTWQNEIGKIRNDCLYKIKILRDTPNNHKEHVVQVPQNRDPTTIVIDVNGTGNYTTIQEGIDNSVNGDTVLVYPGIYFENINYNGKNITVASLYIQTQKDSFIHKTTIDGNHSGSVVTFSNGEDSTAILCGFTIQNGSGTIYHHIFTCGGGIYCYCVNPIITDCIIKNNTAQWGGGIQCLSSNITLINVTVNNNHAISIGGGICFRDDSTVNFDFNNRCNIYLNYAAAGSDILLFDCNEITEIVADTFTVLNPDQDFVNTFFSYDVSFNIFNAKIEPVNQDLYVGPTGNNINSGLSEEYPLKTISYALLKIASDSTQFNNIHLDEGTYSSSLTGERFPLNARSYVGIIGESEQRTILDGDSLIYLVNCCFYDKSIHLENITIQNGRTEYGEGNGTGIRFEYCSNGIVKNATIKDNIAIEGDAGGIFCMENSNPTFDNVTIIGNTAEVGGGVKVVESNPIFLNCIISYNSADPTYIGTAGISCINESSIILINTLLNKNSGNETAGIYLGTNCHSTTINNSFVDNNGNNTIYLRENGNIELVNSIIWNNTNKEIVFYGNYAPNYAEIFYTDIKGGESGINTNNNGTYYWGPGNINQAPLFVDSLNDNYQLLQGSPCIDAGTPDTSGLNLPATDLAANPRIFNGRIDIGAYEYQGYGIDEPDTSFIHNLYLFNNTPNPFRESTTISFISADYERIKEYTLSIYNTKGQLVRRYEGNKDNFWVKTEIVWNGTDEYGKQVAPGAYFYKLEYNGHAVVRKMTLLR